MKQVLENRSAVARKQAVASKRSLDLILGTLDELAQSSASLLAKPLNTFETGGEAYHLPRYLFIGPKGGGDTIRIGLFATLRGDEPEGALGLVRFITELERHPELAKGFALFIYPICNPTGFEQNTPHSRRGKDLSREFWSGSTEPEIRSLETEIWTHAFHGIVTLRSDASSSGIYGHVNGAILSEHLLEPALRAAEAHLPRNKRRHIDNGYPARRGIIHSNSDGSLRGPQGLSQPPFEVTLETPQNAPLHLQVSALNTALQTVLTEYRYLLALAQNI